MKQLLLVLFVLAITIPAGADILVYTMSDKGVSFMEDSPDWKMEKENAKGYIILEGSEGDPTVDIWVIGLGKSKNPSTGKTQKEVSSEYTGEFNLIIAENEAGNKQYWIIVGGDEHKQVMLTGVVKSTKIGDEKWDIAKKLTGTAINDEEEIPGQRDISSTKVSMSLNTKYTVEAKDKGYDGEEAQKALMDYLVNEQGYIDTTP